MDTILAILAIFGGLYMSHQISSCNKRYDAKQVEKAKVCAPKCKPHPYLYTDKNGKCICDGTKVIR